jgi:RNA polymerase sigma factor (sigma-70 family)
MTNGTAAAWNGAMGDRELVERCLRRDRRAWAELFHRYDRRLARVLARAAGSGLDPADLRQEVWAKLFENDLLARLRLERPGALDAFMRRVALRVAVDAARHRRARLFEVDARLSGQVLDPEAAAMNAQQLRHLAAALQRTAAAPVAARNLRILRSYLVEGRAPAQIAGSGAGLTAKGVASLVRRALRKAIDEVASERPPAGKAKGRAAGIRPRTP